MYVLENSFCLAFLLHIVTHLYNDGHSKTLKSAALYKIPTLTIYDVSKFIFPNEIKAFKTFSSSKFWVGEALERQEVRNRRVKSTIAS